MRTRSGIACFGEALIDFLATPPADPRAPRMFAQHAGGAPANVAVGVAHLGGDARFIGMLGADMFGDFLLAELMRYGIGVTGVRRTDAARTALAFVALDEGGERSFEFYRPPAADLLFAAGDFALDAFDDVGILHVCSNSLTEPAIAAATLHGMRRAAEAGALVSMDLNLRPALWPRDVDPLPTLHRALRHAHLVKLSREEAAFIAGGTDEDAAIAALFHGATRAVVVTDGAAPVRWWTRTQRGQAPTFAVTPVDTTAAGDAFVAALLHALVAHVATPDDLDAAFADPAVRAHALDRAAAAGALATTRHGAFAALPTLDEVEALDERRA